MGVDEDGKVLLSFMGLICVGNVCLIPLFSCEHENES